MMKKITINKIISKQPGNEMEDYISISTLNDFIFCPYSIYLHNVYMEADEDVYHATPQTRGRAAHDTVDKKAASTRKGDLMSLPVCSENFGVMGKIDIYRQQDKLLIERKYQMKQIFQGQIFQLWAQYFCMIEMGYEVKHLAFYEVTTNKMLPVALPCDADKTDLLDFIVRFRNYNPTDQINVNPNKCLHCIYCNLCDKTDSENVYT